MARHWTFGQKVGASFALIVALAVAMSVVSYYALRAVVASKDRVIDVEAQLLIDAQELQALREAAAADARGYLLTREDRFFTTLQASRTSFAAVLARLQGNVVTDEGRRLVDTIERTNEEQVRAMDQVIALRRTDAPLDAVVQAFDNQVGPVRERLDAAIQAFVALEGQRLRAATQASTDAASAASTLVATLALFSVLGACVAGFVLTRTLGRQIGTAVSQVQSSSAELQAAATQQATGAKEQATAMTEIATTIGELLATSRQITESAQRVAQIAEETAAAARSGDATVDEAHASIAGIRRQVDLIVGHMLELGKKSQQIGSVLDIVSELAEQTNILAINATIEAAGAGEAGRRFAVVADEIRKLADRVAGSTKEIRGLIEEVRSAVNTTVMATETGAKAVDAGSAQFGRVAAAFTQIAGLVGTTTEAAREIELSTRQQTTAVEQVNVAIANIAQASKETEASSGQTQQTASQLAVLSTDLLRLVRSEAAA
ncbi:MAG: CHASE3 domain-containing protein [Acidobacteria bacterium]|nr:CHASE3 domain-containing protein [Acidobacteriota bacterium]